MNDPIVAGQAQTLEPVHAEADRKREHRWTRWLVWFLRAMAVLSMVKGLYHWLLVLGMPDGPDGDFSSHTLPWQTATVFFAVIDLIAAVGLWLAAVWGAVVWLTAAVSMAAVEFFFPQIYGGRLAVVAAEALLLVCYLSLAFMSAREHVQR